MRSSTGRMEVQPLLAWMLKVVRHQLNPFKLSCVGGQGEQTPFHRNPGIQTAEAASDLCSSSPFPAKPPLCSAVPSPGMSRNWGWGQWCRVCSPGLCSFPLFLIFIFILDKHGHRSTQAGEMILYSLLWQRKEGNSWTSLFVGI